MPVTVNKASDYQTNGLYRTPNHNHNPSSLVHKPDNLTAC